MQKINVKKLMEAITGLEAYKPPIDGLEGVKYLYKRLYLPAVNGELIRIRDIDFNTFELDDVGVFEDYYHKRICGHSRTSYHLLKKLSKLQPIASKARFI